MGPTVLTSDGWKNILFFCTIVYCRWREADVQPGDQCWCEVVKMPVVTGSPTSPIESEECCWCCCYFYFFVIFSIYCYWMLNVKTSLGALRPLFLLTVIMLNNCGDGYIGGWTIEEFRQWATFGQEMGGCRARTIVWIFIFGLIFRLSAKQQSESSLNFFEKSELLQKGDNECIYFCIHNHI